MYDVLMACTGPFVHPGPNASTVESRVPEYHTGWAHRLGSVDEIPVHSRRGGCMGRGHDGRWDGGAIHQRGAVRAGVRAAAAGAQDPHEGARESAGVPGGGLLD